MNFYMVFAQLVAAADGSSETSSPATTAAEGSGSPEATQQTAEGMNITFSQSHWPDLLIAAGIIVAAYIIGKIISAVIGSTAKKFKEKEHIVREAITLATGRSIPLIAISIGYIISMPFLGQAIEADVLLATIRDILLVVAIGALAYHFAIVPAAWFEKLTSKDDSGMDKMIVPFISKTLRVVVFVLIGIQIVQILSDKSITSIVAGLGIGGLAVALAAQDSIGHFFGSIVLLGDKPFKLGDRIIVEGHDGPIESVGLRSTRMRTLEGHVITIPNGQLANKIIQNVTGRKSISRVMNIGITYDTPLDKIHEALDICKDVLKDHEGMNEEFPPRIYFNDYGPAHLNILIIYWYFPPDYWKFMDFSEKVNLEIFKRFEEAGIDFAFPTQTLYLAGDPSRPLSINTGSLPQVTGEKETDASS